ncbi:VIT1/CCC1 transporter family protein [Anaerolentibacter hominis]|uniref:VIT1/CCC1 transporter family protein n=1 Tax=Anaerolentibacter hominis TaxID=3079009 RepID=UPI0031B7F8D2
MGNPEKISEESLRIIRRMQQNEVTEAATYRAIASRVKDGENKAVLLRLAQEEERHAKIWEKYTGEVKKPQRGKVLRRKIMAALLGFTFVIKLMENGEEGAQDVYGRLEQEIPESTAIREQENAHEDALMSMLDEERLQYVGSMVLGMNDALVELTGTLAGLSLALQNTRIIALSGLITGISATLSMASSEFLSAKSDGEENAFKSCIYTGIAYLVTVTLLVLPYLIFSPEQWMFALGTMLVTVVVIIAAFNYYIAVAKGLPFKRRFAEMACISLGVAALSFVVGLLVKKFLGVDI